LQQSDLDHQAGVEVSALEKVRRHLIVAAAGRGCARAGRVLWLPLTYVRGSVRAKWAVQPGPSVL